MAATDLQFSKNSENRYEAQFVSEGAVTIQMERSGSGYINVYANLDGMDKKFIGGYGSYNGGSNEVFTVDVPSGITVTIESLQEVVSAKMLSNG
jgi:hypothetical protein